MIAEKIREDLTRSLKNKEALRLSTLRMLVSELKNAEIALRPLGKEVDDAETLKVIGKEAKKRKESIEIFTTAGREDLASKEREELAILEEYLPEQMAEAEVEAIIKADIALNPGIAFGDLMRIIMPKFKDKADGKMVSQIANKLLNEDS